MDNLLKIVAAVVVVTAIHLLSKSRTSSSAKKLPPGSLGLPVIGQTLSVVRAWRANCFERWIHDRIERYGPVSKLSMFFTPTVLVAGPAANKFMLFSSELRVMQADSFTRLVGERSIVDLQGEDHRHVHGALMEFLKPDMLKRYIGRIDTEVRRHLAEEWHGCTTVTLLPLTKQWFYIWLSRAPWLCASIYGYITCPGQAGGIPKLTSSDFKPVGCIGQAAPKVSVL